MTPMPDSIVLRIFPLDGRDADAIVAGEGESRETARNVAMLAEWDDDFAGFVDDDDDDDDVDDDENKNVYDEVAGMIDADENDMGGGTDRVGGRDMHGIGPGKKGRATSQPLAPGGRTMKRGRKRTPYKKDGGGIGGRGGNGRRGGGRVGSSSSSRRRESRSYAKPEHVIIMEERNNENVSTRSKGSRISLTSGSIQENMESQGRVHGVMSPALD